MQMEGIAELAHPVGAVRSAFRAHAHIFRPTRIRYLDNRHGIGVRFSVGIVDGKAVWLPRGEATDSAGR